MQATYITAQLSCNLKKNKERRFFVLNMSYVFPKSKNQSTPKVCNISDLVFSYIIINIESQMQEKKKIQHTSRNSKSPKVPTVVWSSSLKSTSFTNKNSPARSTGGCKSSSWQSRRKFVSGLHINTMGSVDRPYTRV